MKKALLLLSLALLLGSGSALFAREIASVMLPDEVRLKSDGPVLKLNGAGIRTKFLFKIYVAGLYLPKPATDIRTIIGMDGPKRVLMHFVYKEVPRDKLVEGWVDGFSANVGNEQMAALQSRLDEFNAMFETVHVGDEIWLDWVPGEGTRVTLMGEPKGVIPGEDFYQALLRVWLGEHPVSAALRDGLLGI